MRGGRWEVEVGGGRWEVGGGRWEVGGGRWEVGGGRYDLLNLSFRSQHIVISKFLETSTFIDAGVRNFTHLKNAGFVSPLSSLHLLV